MGSAPRWVRAVVTALAAAAVFVGTFLEFYRQESDGQVSSRLHPATSSRG